MKEVDEHHLSLQAVQEYMLREDIILSVHYHIMSKEDLNPSLLELDLNEFYFSQYLLQENKVFAVDLKR